MSKNYIKDLFIVQILTFLTIPIGFLIRMFYSRTLTLEHFGYIYSLIFFFNFLTIFVNLGLSASLKRSIPKLIVQEKYIDIKNLFWYTFLINLFTVLTISAIIFLSVDLLSLYYFHDINIKPFILIFCIFFIFNNLITTLHDVFISYQLNINHQIFSFSKIFLILFLSVITYLLAFENLAYKFALYYGLSHIIIFLIYMGVVLYKFPYLRQKPQLDKKLLRQHFSYSFYIFISGLGLMIFSRVDSLIITYFLGTNQTGIYTNVFAIINMIISVFASFSMLLMSIFSQKQEEKDFRFLNKVLALLYDTVVFFILPVALICAFFAKTILKLFYGNQFIVGSSILVIFSIFVLFKLIYTYNLNFLNGLGLAKSIAKMIIGVSLLNLILNLLLVNVYGLSGIAVSTVLSWILLSILTSRILFKQLNFKFNFQKYIFIFLTSIIFTLILFILKPINFFNNFYLNSTIILGISLVVYYILGYIFKIYRINDLYVLIPFAPIKQKIRYYHKKYFWYLK